MKDNAPAHLKSLLQTSGRERDNEESGLPSLQEGEYQAHARPTQKAVHALHLVLPSGIVHSFQYVHLDSSSRYIHKAIELRFIGFKLVNVIIEGRNLWKLYDYIHQHRMPWVQQAARDFSQEGETIVSRISITEPTLPSSGA